MQTFLKEKHYAAEPEYIKQLQNCQQCVRKFIYEGQVVRGY